jgi:hypothetical protein
MHLVRVRRGGLPVRAQAPEWAVFELLLRVTLSGLWVLPRDLRSRRVG